MFGKILIKIDSDHERKESWQIESDLLIWVNSVGQKSVCTMITDIKEQKREGGGDFQRLQEYWFQGMNATVSSAAAALGRRVQTWAFCDDYSGEFLRQSGMDSNCWLQLIESNVAPEKI